MFRLPTLTAAAAFVALSVTSAVAATVTLDATKRDAYDNLGNKRGFTNNYQAGDPNTTSIDEARNYFVFDLSGVTDTIVAAELHLVNPSTGFSSGDTNETYELFDVSTSIAALEGNTGGGAAFTDLGTGTQFGSHVASSADNNTTVIITLNAAAITALDAASGEIAIGGAITTLDGDASNSEFLFGFTTGQPLSDTQLVLTTVEPGGIGTIKPGAFTPDPNGNGRAVAFDGLLTLYYTFVGDSKIYKASTAGVSLGPIPISNRAGFTCGALSFDGTDLWCGTFDGGANADVYTINPTTGLATLVFNTAAFGGFDAGQCLADSPGLIDGLAFDASDNTLWLSADVDRKIYHVSLVGVLLGKFPTPSRPSAAMPGCNSGIEVAPGGFLELVLLGPDAGVSTDGGADPKNYIVKVAKDDISGTPIVTFPTQDPNAGEDLAFDAKTFAPRAVVWNNAFTTNEIKAYDVQVTRTIGYWKNHPAEDFDTTSFLPIDLGDNDENGVCETAATDQDVEDFMKAHKGQDAAPKLLAQLLAAELNLAMGDIPQADVDAIETVIEDAHELLGRNACDPDTGKKGDDRTEAQELHALLDAFNNKYSP